MAFGYRFVEEFPGIERFSCPVAHPITSSTRYYPLAEIRSDKMLVRNWAWLHSRLGLDHFWSWFRIILVVCRRVSITFFVNKHRTIWRHLLEHTISRFPAWFISPIPNHLSVTQTWFWGICSSVTPKLITFLKSTENSAQKLCFWRILKILDGRSGKYQKVFFVKKTLWI